MTEEIVAGGDALILALGAVALAQAYCSNSSDYEITIANELHPTSGTANSKYIKYHLVDQ